MTDPRSNVATPYGVLIHPETVDLNGKPEDMISIESTAKLLGIHDPADRVRFGEEAHAMIGRASGIEDGPVGDLADIVTKYGGWSKVVRVPIHPPAAAAIYPTIPHERGVGDATDGASLRDAVDSWVAIAADASRWHERADVILDCVARQVGEFSNTPRGLVGQALSNIVTAVLENMGETEVACLEASAIYALSAHPPWRAAGREWLLPHRKTWVRDWIATRPIYRRLARLTGMVHRDVPSWLKEITQ